MDHLSCSLCGSRDCMGTTVPAGEVAVSLAGCGYETAMQRLPKMHFEEQEYSSGLCPNCALAKGTMFPELVSTY